MSDHMKQAEEVYSKESPTLSGKDIGTHVVRSDSDEQDTYLDSTKVAFKSPYSPWFTIACAGFALVSDGYQNNLMT